MEKIKWYLYVGSNIPKKPTYYHTLKDYYKEFKEKLSLEKKLYTPVQIFTGSPKSFSRKEVELKDKEATLQYIKKKKIKLFVHSIYMVNLAKPNKEVPHVYSYLIKELKISNEIGALGVVIHVGKYVKLDPKDGLKNMYENMISVLPYINVNTPLLLETPAGQGTELLVKYDEFRDFYLKFTKEEKTKIKICIDTCHIFAAGHNPCEYISNWLKEVGRESLVLVHFNDSKEEIGSCKDRHEFPGKGCIGEKEMVKTMELCKKNKIPMVYE